MPDPQAVNSMFGRIAGRYDLANRLLSGGIDVWWRKKLIRAVARDAPADVLDLATGSGDVAFALADGLPAETPITGMDFCRPMLDAARIKQRDRGGYAHIAFREGDGLNLPIGNETYDAATISFGLRNMADRERCLSELHRVLRPGGQKLVIAAGYCGMLVFAVQLLVMFTHFLGGQQLVRPAALAAWLPVLTLVPWAAWAYSRFDY